jgi:hypothetical protein
MRRPYPAYRYVGAIGMSFNAAVTQRNNAAIIQRLQG